MIAWLKSLFASPQVMGAVPRSSHWPAVRDAFLKANPTCAVCGCRDDIEAHHCDPYHLHPERELDPTNLIALCRRDHLLFGHLGNWSSWNPSVREDAALWRAKILNRPHGGEHGSL